MQLGRITSFEWNRVDVSIPVMSPAMRGLRIVHLSDLHLRPEWWPVYDRLIDEVAAEPPDLIVVTGDFVEHRADHRATLPTVRRLLGQLQSRQGTYAIVGNHDGDLLRPRLQEIGVHILCGRTARLKSKEATIELIGVPSVSRFDLRDQFVRSILPRESGVPRLVLSHFPDSILELDGLEADLILSGHTHGGQVCLPGGFPIITHDRLPRRMCRGIHDIGDKLLIVNRGLGFASMSMRLFCPPEVVEIRLQPR